MTQEEANGLIEVLKRIKDPSTYAFPRPGIRASNILQLISFFSKDLFLVDIKRSSTIDDQKYTLQMRYKKENILLRLDCGSSKHGNPDGSIIECPHFHIFQEGYGDKWAYPLPQVFSNPEDLLTTLKEFLIYCHTTNISELLLQDQQDIGGMLLEGNAP